MTAGSSHTIADAEQMAGLLQGAKFNPAENTAEADIILFHACTNRTVTEENFLQRLEQLHAEYPYKVIIVSGCVSYALTSKLKKYSLLGTKQIHHVVEAVEEAMNDNVVKIIESKEMPPLNMPRLRKNSPAIIIPINRGCGEFIPTKKKEKTIFFKSYSPEEIRTEVEKALQQGAREIILSSVDASKYGHDLKTNLPTLLNTLLAIPGNFKLRLGMMSPANVMRIKNDLISCFKQDKMYKFLYLPLFAGTNDILKEMKQPHSVEQFLQILTDFRSEIPELALMTDVIVGFPLETGEQYWETLNIIRKANPDMINILHHKVLEKENKKTEPLPEDIIARRSSVLTDIYHNIARIQNERWMGWKGEIILTEKGPEQYQWVGRNPAYKPVIVEGNFKIGDIVNVQIIRAGTFELRAELVK